jgi:hypothetical protein
MSVTRIMAISAFVVAGLIFAFIEWRARREHSRIPTLSDVCAFVMTYRAGRLPVGRIAMYGFWWWVGWHFFAR